MFLVFERMAMAMAMAATPLPPPTPPRAPNNNPPLKLATFDRIPSWVTLKAASSSPEARQGRVENLHLISLCRQGSLEEANRFLRDMVEAGVAVTHSASNCLFRTCGELKSLQYARLIHEQLITSTKKVKNPPGFLEESALRMYCDLGSLREARKVFDGMRDRNLSSWDTMISAYSKYSGIDEAMQLFFRMLLEVGSPEHPSIYDSLLRALTDPSLVKIGEQLHCLVIKCGLGSDVSISTGICSMYVRFGSLEAARLVFGHMDEKRNAAVVGTGLMVGYIRAEKMKEALLLYEDMVREDVELDEFVFSAVLKACACLEDLKSGQQIHGYITKLGLVPEVSVGTPLVDFYVKCGHFQSAFRIFEMIKDPNDVSWCTVLSGYAQSGNLEECLNTFKSLRTKDEALNPSMYTTVFQACSVTVDLCLGAQSHADATKRGLVSSLLGESALISMYSKCGKLNCARRVFESIHGPDTVAWTAMISGHSYHGNASEALGLFRRMLDHGAKPNAVTFVAVLTACSHSNMVAEAKGYLDRMAGEYGVSPTADHYNCMVDVYSRAGLLDEAFDLIKSGRFKADAMSWKCLLSGCWNHQNLELGKIASENLIKLDPNDTAGYVLMFNLYASFGKWEEAAEIRRKMAERNLRKDVSCSWITVQGKVHRFVVGDRHHPQTEKIYSKLRDLDSSADEFQSDSYLTEADGPSTLPERKQQLLNHSERLAIAFGIIASPSKAQLVIFKNLRACRGCHEFAKHVSLIEDREIVVRDASRFHHFKQGRCSCCDYW